MAGRALGLFVFFAQGSIFDGARVAGSDTEKNKFKCVYTWQGKEGSPLSTASFGVSNCRVYCEPRIGEYRFNKVFAKYFKGKTVGKMCSCQNMQGEELFKMPRACRGDGAADCLADYLKQATDTYVFTKNNAVTVEHHEELYHESTFKSECVEEQCSDGKCDHLFLPSLESTRTEQEKEALAEVLKVAVIKGTTALTRDQKEIVEKMGQHELHEMIEMVLEREKSPVEKEELQKRMDAFEQHAAEGASAVSSSSDKAPAADGASVVSSSSDKAPAADGASAVSSSSDKAPTDTATSASKSSKSSKKGSVSSSQASSASYVFGWRYGAGADGASAVSSSSEKAPTATTATSASKSSKSSKTGSVSSSQASQASYVFGFRY
eukprot:TRINITY_DN23330_c0_g2_i1.p1 TRINITY_DN23330_c0_g2~~TRINITY_DN23330_c0_g2_i1.p1  ORF type:complete len:379 (-),score=74.67 TRINITY_DN23330_c0_g2_i1:198-1334(-)